MTNRLSVEDIDILTLGSSLLGSGGGGNPYIGGLLLKTTMQKMRIDEIEIIDPISVEDESRIICSSGMGSPTIGSEKIPNGKEYALAITNLENDISIKFDYISPIEIGGINSVVPFISALFKELPVLDGDGEGRAFPELQMTTFNLYGVSSTPMCLVDERGNSLIIRAIDSYWAEKISRSATAKFGGRGYIANYPMNGVEYKRCAIRNSVTRAIDIGKLLSEGIKNFTVEEALVKYAKATMLFEGKLVDLVRNNGGGFSIGYALFQSDSNEKRYARIRFQNEYLFFDLKQNGKMTEIISTPEIICVLDSENYTPITTDRLRYGLRCTIFSLPVSEKWDNPKSGRLIGKEAFKSLNQF